MQDNDDPGTVPTRGMEPSDIWPDAPTARRLCRLTFDCPLCGEQHIIDQYVTVPEQNQQEFGDGLQQMRQDPQVMATMMASAIRFTHQEKGDMGERARRALAGEIHHPLREPALEVLEESDYTCDGCHLTFESMGELRTHMAACPRFREHHESEMAGEPPPSTARELRNFILGHAGTHQALNAFGLFHDRLSEHRMLQTEKPNGRQVSRMTFQDGSHLLLFLDVQEHLLVLVPSDEKGEAQPGITREGTGAQLLDLAAALQRNATPAGTAG